MVLVHFWIVRYSRESGRDCAKVVDCSVVKYSSTASGSLSSASSSFEEILSRGSVSMPSKTRTSDIRILEFYVSSGNVKADRQMGTLREGGALSVEGTLREGRTLDFLYLNFLNSTIDPKG